MTAISRNQIANLDLIKAIRKHFTPCMGSRRSKIFGENDDAAGRAIAITLTACFTGIFPNRTSIANVRKIFEGYVVPSLEAAWGKDGVPGKTVS